MALAYEYSKLLGKIIEVCGSQVVFAKQIGLSERSVSLKLNNKTMFKQDEITKTADILGIPTDEILAYFFTLKVQND